MRRVHYVLSTHWDREWYQTFQDYRYRLVQLLDRVIAGWEREELNGPFQTDGQAIILEDYLEVRPERRALVERLVRDGRFKVGPWYVLPDEFLVSGESIIRNLRLGREIVRRFGGVPSNAGFMCDMFGHNSQMPQIFAGFGFPGALVWRGTNNINKRVFKWRGADGTELPAYRFGKVGYCTFAIGVRQMDLTMPEYSEQQIAERLQAFLKDEDQEVPVGPMLAFDGCDHAEWDPAAYQVISKYIDNGSDTYKIIHSTLDDYLAELAAVDGQIDQVLEGELRDPARYPDYMDTQWLIPGVASSRVRLKQYNAACQTLLCQWAEPVSAFAECTLNMPYPQGYLDVAWRWLLQNHPHDSICGCSIDAVHEDMIYRFHQCEGIANRLTLEATRKIAANIQGEVGDNELRVTVFNPLPHPVSEVSVLDLELPVDWPSYGEMTRFETRPAFRIYDSQGQEMDYQRLGQSLDRTRFRIFDTTFPRGYKVNVVRVAIKLSIPALGYITLTVRPGQPGIPTIPAPAPSLVTGHRTMANENICVNIETNGTITILDRRNGNTYRNLLTFEDTADIGDGWNYGPAENDQAYLSTACHADIALVSSGPQLAAYRIRTRMDLPAQFDFSTMTRAEQREGLLIDSLVTLKAGADQVEVETTVHNNIKDHRLRVLFPSRAGQALTYLADAPFDVVERPIALRADNHLYREPEIETKPQQNFTAVFDDQRGLAVLSPGLFESAVMDNEERTLALTLLRATRRTVFTDGEPGGQMQGDLTFKYAIMPLEGKPDRARLLNSATLLAAGLRAAQLRKLDVEYHRGPRLASAAEKVGSKNLPPEGSFLSLTGGVVLTSLRRTSAGLELRVFNPSTQTTQAELSLADWLDTSPRPAQAVWVNLESLPIGEPFSLSGEILAFEVKPKQIRTLCLIG